jgi:hypothetical protein
MRCATEICAIERKRMTKTTRCFTFIIWLFKIRKAFKNSKERLGGKIKSQEYNLPETTKTPLHSEKACKKIFSEPPAFR